MQYYRTEKPRNYPRLIVHVHSLELGNSEVKLVEQSSFFVSRLSREEASLFPSAGQLGNSSTVTIPTYD